jgi:hypothetical protein
MREVLFMVVKLSVLERILVAGLLPKENNFAVLRMVRDCKKNLSFNEEEFKDIEMKVDENGSHWNALKAVEKDFEISDILVPIISGVLKQMSDANCLSEEHFSLYEKFVGE